MFLGVYLFSGSLGVEVAADVCCHEGNGSSVREALDDTEEQEKMRLAATGNGYPWLVKHQSGASGVPLSTVFFAYKEDRSIP